MFNSDFRHESITSLKHKRFPQGHIAEILLQIGNLKLSAATGPNLK